MLSVGVSSAFSHCSWSVGLLCLIFFAAKSVDSQRTVSHEDIFAVDGKTLSECTAQADVRTDVEVFPKTCNRVMNTRQYDAASFILSDFDVKPFYKVVNGKNCQGGVNVTWRIEYDDIAERFKDVNDSQQSEEMSGTGEIMSENSDSESGLENVQNGRTVFELLIFPRDYPGAYFCIDVISEISYTSNRSFDFAYDCMILVDGDYSMDMLMKQTFEDGSGSVQFIIGRTFEINRIDYCPHSAAPPGDQPPHPIQEKRLDDPMPVDRSFVIIIAVCIVSFALAIALSVGMVRMYRNRRPEPSPDNDNEALIYNSARSECQSCRTNTEIFQQPDMGGTN